jgi:sugar (pentulose or hexulose) kinase
MAKYVIGVDGGTESLRAGVFDTAGVGRPAASCAADLGCGAIVAFCTRCMLAQAN